MVANPMQKMKRNSILIGLIIGLVVGLILCVLLYMFLQNNGSIGTKGGQIVSVAVLNKTIKSGTEITEADVVMKQANSQTVPTDATNVVVGSIAKIDLTAGTILSNNRITAIDSQITKDSRVQEYNMISLPTQLAAGDYIDVRLQLPDGGDYIVVAKKRVQNANASTVWIEMNEEEILTMSNAIVEYYVMAGSKLYATTYSQPGMQDAASPTYTPNATVASLIYGDPNITSQISDGQGRFSARLKEIRNSRINSQLSRYDETGLENLETSIQEEIESLKETRQAYFGVLDSASQETE